MVVFRQLSLLALAALPFSLAQVSNDFESGWDQTAWPIYAPDCNQVILDMEQNAVQNVDLKNRVVQFRLTQLLRIVGVTP
jgi:hypothetical protein